MKTTTIPTSPLEEVFEGITGQDITLNNLVHPDARHWVKAVAAEIGFEEAIQLWDEHEACHLGEPGCHYCQLGIK